MKTKTILKVVTIVVVIVIPAIAVIADAITNGSNLN